MASQTMMNGLKGIAAFVAIAGGGVMLLKLQYDSSPAGQAVAAKLEQQENDRPLINVAETLVRADCVIQIARHSQARRSSAAAGRKPSVVS